MQPEKTNEDLAYEAGKKRLFITEVIIVVAFSAIALYWLGIGRI